MTFKTYRTIQGDTFDAISLDFFGDEKYASEIIKINPDKAKIIIFDAGVDLKIPVIDSPASSTLPPWRKS